MPVTAYPCIDSGTSVLALVHDAWAPYDTCRQAGDQLFTAHLAREPTAAIDHHHAANEPGSWCWATQALDALTPVERAWKEHPDGRGTKTCRPKRAT